MKQPLVPAQMPTFLYPLQGAVFIAQRRVLWNRVSGNFGKYVLYAIPTLLLIYVGYIPYMPSSAISQCFFPTHACTC